MKALLLFSLLITFTAGLYASSDAYTCDWSKFRHPTPTASSPAGCLDEAIAFGAQNVTEVSISTGTTVHTIRFRTSNWGMETMYARYNSAVDTCTIRDDYGECLEEGCIVAKPITSSTKAQTACYNQCGYTTLGGFRDYDNALAPMAYEYLPTGEVCTGNEENSQLAGVSEYTEINEEELDCRSDPGVQVCISEDKTCKIVNGYPVCFDEATNQDELNCGTFNGEVVCFEKNAYSNCQYVNGEYLCTYPEGDKVDPDSVDHPINGGNANGQTHDDILDQQDLTENTPEAQTVKQIVKETGIRQQAEKQAESDNPSSSISGLGCDKEVSCTGDAIQCAIARIQKKQLCLSEFNESDINSIISGNSEMSPLGTLPGDTLEVHVDDFLETDEYVTSDNQCPDPLSYTVLGVEYEIILNPLCDLASYISYFITFATWFSMSVVLAKSMGTG
ncbi:virulence factor TspB C-terminal domain-related protein [Endozoicomonas ascidiicola]|uniref:virulence factor TspB C-terminal domain-related protein n=1 Tax=Endozoicomonas ascidiicola TaxID=1698521 RepID=UPI001FE04229|nr:virulence factor TspB C-terminal domain-related protein [Endozoicomonas ascidiicola]